MSAGKQTGATGLRLILLNSSYQSITNLYYLVIRGAYIILFARLLGAELYGNYVYAHSWYLLAVAVTSWGMNELMIAETAQRKEQGKQLLAASGLGLRLALALAGTVTVALAAILFEPDRELRLLVLLYSQGVLVRGAMNWFHALFQMRESSQYWMYIFVVSLTLEVAIAVYLALNEAGLIAIASSQIVIWWLTLAALWIVYRWHFHTVLPRFDREQNRFFLALGLPLGIAALILSCLGPGLMIVCRYFIDKGEELGQVAFAVQLLVILGQMIRMVSHVALPQLNQLSDQRRQRQSFFLSTLWAQSMFLGGIAFAMCYLLLEPLVAAVVGSPFDGAARLFSQTCWLLIPLALLNALRLLMLSERQPRKYLGSIIACFTALTVQILGLAILEAFSPLRLLVALGIAYSIGVVILLSVALRLGISLDRVSLLTAPLLFGICLLLFFNLAGSTSGILPMAAVIPLALASVVHFRWSYARMSAK